MRETRRVRQIREKAYSGANGARRRDFCRAYRETFTRIRAKTETQFAAKLSFLGEKVSCAKGCSTCCFQHISAPVVHGIAVVDFLYEKDHILTQFLRNYKPWQEKAGAQCGEIDNAYNAAIDPRQEFSYGTSGQIMSRRYFAHRIPCPFLVNAACSIYDIRPLCCSAHLAVTPGEWCDPADTHEVRTYEAVPESSDLQALVALAPVRLSLYHLTLPIMVYRMLTQDLSVILEEVDRRFPDPKR